MAFRAMDAGCGGVDGDDIDAECGGEVTAAGLYVASTGTVWLSFACDAHVRQLIGPRELHTRDHDALRRRQQRAQDPRIGRRYAGEPDGPLAGGAAASRLVREALEWGKRHPFHTAPTATGAVTERDRQLGEAGRMSVDDLADELGVHPGDVRVLLSWLDPDHGGLHPDGTLLNEYAGTIRDQLDHLCERTVPDYWWPGHDPDAGTGATKMR